MASSIQWTWDWTDSRRQWRQGSLACCSPWGHKGLDMTVTEHKQQRGFMIFSSPHSSDWLVSIYFTVLAFRKRKLKMWRQPLSSIKAITKAVASLLLTSQSLELDYNATSNINRPGNMSGSHWTPLKFRIFCLQ